MNYRRIDIGVSHHCNSDETIRRVEYLACAGEGVTCHTVPGSEKFAGVLRGGQRADGASLYSAMPYPAQARISDENIHAFHIDFMKGDEPAMHQPGKTDLSISPGTFDSAPATSSCWTATPSRRISRPVLPI